MSIAHAQWQPTCFFMIQYGGFLSEKKVSLHFSLFTVITSDPQGFVREEGKPPFLPLYSHHDYCSFAQKRSLYTYRLPRVFNSATERERRRLGCL